MHFALSSIVEFSLGQPWRRLPFKLKIKKMPNTFTEEEELILAPSMVLQQTPLSEEEINSYIDEEIYLYNNFDYLKLAPKLLIQRAKAEKITKLEYKVLRSIADSDYCDVDIFDKRFPLWEVWQFDVSSKSKITGRKFSGVVSSLVSKKWVEVGEDLESAVDPKEASTICITKEGQFAVLSGNITYWINNKHQR